MAKDKNNTYNSVYDNTTKQSNLTITIVYSGK